MNTIENTVKNTNEINDLNDIVTTIALLGEGKHTCATLAAKIDEIVLKINELATQPQPTQTKGKGVRDYGPDSQRKMDDLMAWRIMFGDLIGTPVKNIAETYGLSRGQVYSVRGGYTFTKVGREEFDMIDVVAAGTGKTRAEVEAEIDAKKTEAK